ncbi:ABC transporter substrate-binding protein [Streptomyces sp. OfavH-34-F]|uniref:ABC transporter substrate-binding protein n=1 Tax=Streptomyces sp. OfavH-34-F TaxID=2917760 RepID=UPI001EF33521|nr:ABC transporter substrate-binding protein [Streptomyces sp. OfavH-34-F]MCG7523046.1 ABC transporter substrate-binding protein [Streptomyces sp. OfavH-34-F]
MHDGHSRPVFPFSSPVADAVSHRRVPARLAAAVTALSAVLLTAGCGSSDATADSPRESASTAKGFPVTIDNCGVRTTYAKAPSRAVTIHQHPAELMLSLGLKDRMAGTSYPDSAVLPALRKDFASIPQLSKAAPSFEKVLDTDTDFVYGGYASAFAEKEGRSRKAFRDAGIDTYLNRENCAGKKGVTMEDTYAEIRTIGKIFGVPDRASALVSELRTRVDKASAAVKDARDVSVFVYDSGDKSAFTAGGKGLGNELINLAGGRNVFSDLDDVFGDASWEQVVDRKPEVIAIYDYTGSTVAQKKKFLLSQPALANVPAIKNRRFVVLPLTDTLVGVRSADAVGDLARGLHPDSFK